jgi:hypothetical protein
VTLLTPRTLVSRRYLLRHSVPIVCIDLIFLLIRYRLAEPRPVPAVRFVRQGHHAGRQQLRRERSGVLRPRLLCPPRVGSRDGPGVSRLRRLQGCSDGIGRGSHCGADVRSARAHAATQQRAGTDGGAKCLPHDCERVRRDFSCYVVKCRVFCRLEISCVTVGLPSCLMHLLPFA